jgi:NodT family efflux transporter outer membrane factor (OMF) lipoprotein
MLRMSPALPWMLGLGLALGGCAADGPSPGHGLALPASFGVDADRPTGLGRWWARFGSPGLTRLIDEAEIGNFDIAAAAARIEQADAQARIAGAALLPSIGASADGSRAQSSGTGFSGPVRRPSLRSSVAGVLSASYEIDVWGRNRDLLRASLTRAEAVRYERDVVRLSAQGAIANAYFTLAASRERLAIASGNLNNAERLLRIIRERLAAGTGAALDLAQQESLVAVQRASLPALRQNADASRTALALLVGRAPQGFMVGPQSLTALRAPAIRPGLPSSLLARRPDLRNAEAQLAAADADVSAARKAFLPSVQLTGQGGLQSAALNTLLRPESAIWSLAAGLTQPIFEGGRLTGQVDAASGQRRELLELYRRAVVSALVDVENALVAIRETAAREAAQAVAVEKAREAFRFAEQRLNEGTIDLQTLLNTQATLFQTQDNLVQDRLARLQATLSLFQALGGDFAAP